MEPVEINAGDIYLRQLRADRHLDDRPVLVESFADPVFRRYTPQLRIDDLTQAADYIALRAVGWTRDERCSWAIAEPTTGALLGEVGLKNLDLADRSAEASIWVRPDARGRGIAVTAVEAAIRFGFGALDLRKINYCAESLVFVHRRLG